MDYKLDSRSSVKLSGPLVFCTLLHGLLYDTNISLRSMAAKFEDFTGVALHHSTLGKRIRALPVGFFAETFEYVHEVVADRINTRSPGPLSVHKIDATTVSLSAKLCSFGLNVRTSSPTKGRTLVKSVFELHDQMPSFLHLCKDKSDHSDSIAIGQAVKANCSPGELWVFDKGCQGKERLLDIHKEQAYFLTPHSTQCLAPLRVAFVANSEAAPTDAPAKDEPDYVVVRVEECLFESTDVSRSKPYKQMPLSVVRGYRYDRRVQRWNPLVLMTNLSLSEDTAKIGPYSYEELARVYRDRWEIETFFKKLKGHLSYDHLLSRSENGIKIMIYMALIAAMLMIWAKQVTNSDAGWNIVKYWLEVSCRDWIDSLIRTQYHLERASCRAG
jgi:hypothetical protein